MYIVYRHDGTIVGRGTGEEDNSVSIPDNMWPKIAADITAFYYDPQSDSIELRPTYEVPVETDLQTIIRIQEAFTSVFYVEDLEVELSFSGEFGQILSAAMACAPYCPTTAIGRKNGSLTTILVGEGEAHSIALAYSRYLREQQ